MDFEGMQEALQPYDGLVIEAKDEAEAEKIILKKIKEKEAASCKRQAASLTRKLYPVITSYKLKERE